MKLGGENWYIGEVGLRKRLWFFFGRIRLSNFFGENEEDQGGG